ncbi:MAG: aminoglycoside phosphotransferase family protein [Treponema sp.]|jgi:Ser/Thr protein kinase RdoA (MazF antagonist)|nr:aminoglycoside phosphotransferase family protein [Treponema sp.]
MATGDRTTAALTLAREAVREFALYGDFLDVAPFGGGHINDTFVSRWNQAGTTVRYIHQRINDQVFPHPDQVMENILRVTGHIAGKAGGSDIPPSRRTLTVVPAKDGKSWVRDSMGGWWRTYLFIEGTHTLELAVSPEDARFLGKSVGLFQKQLASLPPPRLHESIPDFHNMEKRYLRFYRALSQDSCNRAGEAAAEIAFMRENEERGAILIRSLREGHIPERICHNDTKMNNILIDDAGGSALCVGDLDTVMPGTSLFDVGDLIRTVTTRAEEDERDLSKVAFDPVFFKALLEGYLSEALEFLTPEEKELLAEAGRNITQIMALRFLTDYLEGDHYYHIARPGHNLDRCRNQIALIKSMDRHWEEAKKIADQAALLSGSC